MGVSLFIDKLKVRNKDAKSRVNIDSLFDFFIFLLMMNWMEK